MLYSIIVGALSGWIASLIMKVDKQMGWKAKGGMINDIIVGIVGAVVLIWLVNMIFGRKR